MVPAQISVIRYTIYALIRTGANNVETALQHQVVRKLQQQLQKLQDLLDHY